MEAFQSRFRAGDVLGMLVLLAVWLPGPFVYARNERTGCIYLCAAAALDLTALGIWLILRRTRRHRRCTVPAKAKVLFNVRSRMRDKKEAFQPVLIYQVKGEWLRAAGSGRPVPLTEGAYFHICYNPNAPEEFRFAGEKLSPLRLCGGPALILLGVLCGAAGVMLWLGRAGVVPVP